MNKKYFRTLRLILGDQLNAGHDWFKKKDDDVLYVMFELEQELSYARHHVQKVCAFLRSMRNFADALAAGGHRVRYFTLDDTAGFAGLTDALSACIEQHRIRRFEYQLPDEYRLDRQLAEFCEALDLETAAHDSGHFLTERDTLKTFFAGKKTWVMENFYRHIRKTHDILMEDGKPAGGRWNYDAENRKSLPKDHRPVRQAALDSDVSDILAMLERHGVETLGSIEGGRLAWPTDRAASRKLLRHFLKHALAHFGSYQDAMTPDDPFVYHSRLSFSLNTKMLHPREVVDAAIAHWHKHSDSVGLAQIEGFVRQIIGWREYMRGVYWAKMPDYADCNHFGHERPLPGFYWNGETGMACMAAAIGQSLQHAYAHHIQRLMVTGNFALLAGCDPDAVDAWYLGIYIDAIEWVEITNTRGMSQFADGGLVGTKPYVSSGNYINKMSDYCGACRYDVKQKSGEGSCPFNSLYWHFIDRHAALLENNPRMRMVYRSWRNMDADKRRAALDTAGHYLARIDAL